MEGDEVIRVIGALEARGIPAGITGGWGIDALLGEQTRRHGDVDLGIDARSVAQAIGALAELGYAVATDARPARVELVAANGRVDLHPVRWQADGSGIQLGVADERFVYPAGSLEADGTIAGQAVKCGTPALQLAFHSDYEPRPHDRRDMAALADRFGLSLPASYS